VPYKIIKEVSLLSKEPTGHTKHYEGSNELPPAIKLQIAQYEKDDGFYLFYLNQSDEVMTDTYHDTIEAAMSQAEWEYNVRPDAWFDRLDNHAAAKH
jgi:hypothetical protein